MTERALRLALIGALLIGLVYAICPISMIWPWNMYKVKLLPQMNNGVVIYKAVFSAAVDTDNDVALGPWPSATGDFAFATSTDYFRRLVASKVLPADFSVFACPGLMPCTDADPKAFRAENNAWCVAAQTADWHAVPDSTPFMFTRNMEISVSEGRVVMRLTNDVPFGTRCAILVNRGGAGFVLTGKQLPKYADRLDPAFVKAILRP